MTTRRVLVVGSTNVDLSAYVDQVPKAGETTHGKSFQQSFGGKGANQAVMVSRFSVPVSMITGLGDDSNGELCRKNFQNEEIDLSFSFDFPGNTGVAHIWIESSGENRIVIIAGSNSKLSAPDVVSQMKKIPDIAVLLCQLEIPLEVSEAALAEAKSRGIATILNLAPYQKLSKTFLENADWLILNEHEYSDFGGTKYSGGLVITLGARGARMIDREGREHLIPGIPVSAVDTTGAGDCLAGAFAAGLSLGLAAEEALEIAVRCSALSVTRKGAQSSYPTTDEVNGIVKQGAYRLGSGR